MGIKQQQSDLDSKWTKGLQLHANEPIQASSINDVEVSWTEANLLVGNLTMDFTTSRGKALDINSSARELVGVKEVMVSESEVAERTQICVKLICIMLCINLVLVKKRPAG